jgi:hypothetical protein
MDGMTETPVNPRAVYPWYTAPCGTASSSTVLTGRVHRPVQQEVRSGGIAAGAEFKTAIRGI